MPFTKAAIATLVALAALSSSGCVATYVGGKAVGAAVDVTTMTARGAVATTRVVGGLVMGGDDCDAEDRDEVCADGE